MAKGKIKKKIGKDKMTCPICKTKMVQIHKSKLRNPEGKVILCQFYECPSCGKQEYKGAKRKIEKQQKQLQQYRVVWEIDIFDAYSPVEAAWKALDIQRNEESIALVFDVVDEKGKKHKVDLWGKKRRSYD